MADQHPIVQIPEGWTYAEKSTFDVGRWVTEYKVSHDACGEVKAEMDNSVGDGGDAWWYREKCAEGLAFFLGTHLQNCPAGATDKGE